MSYEYKVVPAPVRGLKAKGVKTPEDRFANALETAMNDLAADGWEYLRADTLPSEQREGIMGKTTVYQNMLVFRRAKVAAKVAPSRPAPSPQPQISQEPRVTKKLVAPAKPEAPKPPETPDTGKKPGSSPDVAAE